MNVVNWLISVPVWGAHHSRVFTQHTLPALLAAAAKLAIPTSLVSLLLHTDDPNLMAPWTAAGRPGRALKVPPGSPFVALSAAHKQAISVASVKYLTRLVLLTADMVVSSNALTACNEAFNKGKRCVCIMGMRVTYNDEKPPYENSRELLAWGWERRHPMTRESTWPEGKSYDVWRMYFEQGDEVACRLCLPHPLAIIPGGQSRRGLFFRPTIDVNLAENYPLHSIHVVTSPDEAAVIELSPVDKEFLWGETMAARFESRGPSLPSFIQIVNNYRRFFFGQKIVIRGSGGEVGDGPVVARMVHGQ